MVTEKKAKEATERAAKAEEADLSKKDAFAELQKLVTIQQPASEHVNKPASLNGAPKVSKNIATSMCLLTTKTPAVKGLRKKFYLKMAILL